MARGCRVENAQGFKFGILTIVLQIIFIIVFAIESKYGPETDALQAEVPIHKAGGQNAAADAFPHVTSIGAMMVLGFGFLMTFLKFYGFSSIGYNLYLTGMGVQYAIIWNGGFGSTFFKGEKFPLDQNALISGLFIIAAVLISFGAVLGKLSLLQYTIMTLLEIPLVIANEYVGRHLLHVVDVGDSIFVHLMGATFGISVSFVLTMGQKLTTCNEGSRYHSDLFSMIGTLILWIFWPSFNSYAAIGEGQPRAVTNTFLALLGSTMMTFGISGLLSSENTESEEAPMQPYEGEKPAKPNRKPIVFNGRQIMVHVQNSTLAGGVAIGCNADFQITPAIALTIGAAAGTFSVLGYRYVTPKLNRFMHDTCGVLNLHWSPGLFSALMSSILVAIYADTSVYGGTLYNIFPTMAPKGSITVSTALGGVHTYTEGEPRTASTQALMQFFATIITLGLGILGGFLTGILLRFIPGLNQPTGYEMFEDSTGWEVTPRCVEEKTEDLGLAEVYVVNKQGPARQFMTDTTYQA